VGLRPAFFSVSNGPEVGVNRAEERALNPSESEIAAKIAELDPRIELVAVEQPARESLRLFIDHPDGVGLDLCERVTMQVRDLLADYALEVSSPGLDRPLVRPEHFARFVGHAARIRTGEPIGGRRNFTGRLTAADEATVSIESEGETIEIPFDLISRSNLVPELSEVPS
jgi:ribosome maturation factor RimP